jgi:hypothetical protein
LPCLDFGRFDTSHLKVTCDIADIVVLGSIIENLGSEIPRLAKWTVGHVSVPNIFLEGRFVHSVISLKSMKVPPTQPASSSWSLAGTSSKAPFLPLYNKGEMVLW